MPFVRFSRDKRGYEHLYLVDTGGDRGRSRVLYWFRTPPGVRVGRNPFDAATQRALERQNPDVQFDWAQIVAAKIAPPVPVENWREKRRIERSIKRARAEDDTAADPAPDSLMDEPLAGTVEVVEVAPFAEGPVADRAVDPFSPPEIENAPAAPAPPRTDAATLTEPGTAGRRRRRRRGRRRPRPESGPVSAAGNGELDPTAPDPETSNEE